MPTISATRIVPYLLCTYCEEQYTDISDTTSACSTCFGSLYVVVSSIAEHNKRLASKVKVGDSVAIRFLPYDKYAPINEVIILPVIWFDRKNIPLVGTSNTHLYDNHHFITINNFYANVVSIQKWKYCMSLSSQDIIIERIIKGPSPPQWRVGKTLGRTLYLDDKCVGMVDTPEIANLIVKAMNNDRV